MILLSDDSRAESFWSLTAAVEAAKTWYSAQFPLQNAPTWDYKIETFNDLLGAIQDHKARLAQALGYGAHYDTKLKLRAAEKKRQR
jgi:hypothetical protein